jgi:hypothetical protein
MPAIDAAALNKIAAMLRDVRVMVFSRRLPLFLDPDERAA